MLDDDGRAGYAGGEDLAQERLGAGQHEAGRQRVAQPIALAAVPLLDQADGLGERALGGLAQARGHALPCVHHALAAHEADAAVARRLEHGVVMAHRAHIEHRGGARADALEEGEVSRSAQRLGVVQGLEGPDAIAEPVEQLHAIGVVAAQRLAGVQVAVNEAGQHELAPAVDAAAQPGLPSPFAGADADDAIALDHHFCVANHLARGVHGDDGGVADDEIHGL